MNLWRILGIVAAAAVLLPGATLGLGIADTGAAGLASTAGTTDVQNTDVTDAYATIIQLGDGSDPAVLYPDGQGDYVFQAWVKSYAADGSAASVDLSQVSGEAFIRITSLEGAANDLADDGSFYTCDGTEESIHGEIVLCDTLDGDTGVFQLDGVETVTIRVPDARVAEEGLLGEPLGVAVFIPVEASADGPAGAYQAGNGWYNVAKLELQDSPAASSLDWGVSPVVLK